MSKRGYGVVLAGFALAGCAASPEAAQEAPVVAVAPDSLSPRVRSPQGHGRPAQDQPHCDTRAAILEALATRYREAPVALGVTHNGGLVEVLATGDGATWSIIVTTPQGLSCLVAAGENWQRLNPASQDPSARLRVPVHGDAEWIRLHPRAGYCCGDDDCFRDGEKGVAVTQAGPDSWLVTVTPEHPQASRALQRVFRDGGPDVHLSNDDHFWVCVYDNTVRCFFRPGPGM